MFRDEAKTAAMLAIAFAVIARGKNRPWNVIL
jgi:hypothetical protein